MTELIEAILSPVNLLLTIMLVAAMGYWVLVIVGTLAPDSLDFDFDFDADGDIDVDTGHGPGGIALAKFFNLGEVPLMVLLSIFLGVMWFTGVALHPTIGGWAVILQFAMLVPMAIIALLATKLLTQPFKGLLKHLRSGEDAGKIELIGKRCRVISASVDERAGQAEFQTGGAPLRLNIRTADASQTLSRGDEAVIVADRDERGVYIVRGF
jgi:hypothetical protein